jgi:hypothetical protein
MASCRNCVSVRAGTRVMVRVRVSVMARVSMARAIGMTIED